MDFRHVPNSSGSGGSSILSNRANDHVFGGRWYLETDNRWVYPANIYGVSTENISQSAGNNTDPNPSWAALGIPMRAGEEVSGVSLMGRSSSSETTGIEFRLYHQTGDWGGNWVDSTGVSLTLVAASTDIFPTTAKKRYHLPISYTAPTDGLLIPLIKPSGTHTGRKYLYMTGLVEIIKVEGS